MDPSGAVPIYLQICHLVIDQINAGRLAAGTAMPGSRGLAADLGVNRKTVIAAYQELIAQKWLVSDGKRGTFVSLLVPQPSAGVERRGQPGDRLPYFERLTADPFPAEKDDDPSHSDDGLPDSRLFPLGIYSRAYRRALMHSVRDGGLNYGDPRGSSSFRSALSVMLNTERGLSTKPEAICLTRGSQMALFVAARVLIRPGDAVAFEDMTYPPARETFRAAGAKIVHVRLDGHGIDVDHLEHLCRQERIRAVYLTPNHQFPTTVLMRLGRRLRLLSLADQFGFSIIEDDYDHEFHYAHRPMLPLASMAPEKVLYIGSLSKLLAPTLRLGYMVGPEAVIGRAAHEIILIDRQGDAVGERAAAIMIEDGELRRFARRSLAVYRERREVFAARLASEFGGRIAFDTPEGGLAFWCRLLDVDDIERFEMTPLREQLRVGRPSVLGHSGFIPPGFRVGFARLDEKQAEQFFVTLARFWQDR